MPDVFGVAGSDLSLTDAAVFEASGMTTYSGYLSGDRRGHVIYLGALYSPRLVAHPNAYRGTSTSSLGVGYLKLSSPTAGYPSGISATGDYDHLGTAVLATGYLSAANVAGYPVVITYGEGGEPLANTTTDDPVIYTGLFAGPRQWLGNAGYYSYITTIIRQSIGNTIILTDDVTRLREVERALDHSLSLLDATGIELRKILTDNLSITDEGAAVKIVTAALADNLTLSQILLTPSAVLVIDTLSLSDAVVGLTVKEFAFTHSVSPSHAVVGIRERSFSLSDSTTLSHSVVNSRIITASLAHTLTPTHSFSDDHIRAFGQSLNLTQSVTKSKVANRELSHSVSLTDAVRGFTLQQRVSSDLDLGQYVQNTIKSRAASSALLLTQIVTVGKNIQLHEVADTLLIYDGVGTSGSVYRCGVTDTLSITDEVTRPVTGSASNTLSLTDVVLVNRGYSHTLDLGDLVVTDTGKWLADTLELTDECVPNTDASIALADSLDLGQCVTSDARPADHCSYAPAVQVGTSFPPAPTLVRADQITLSYPFASPTTSVVLRNPRREDVRNNVLKRVVRETRGGTLETYRRPTWPKSTVIRYDFDYLKEEDFAALQTFVQTTLGKEIRLTDYESRQWRVIIENPDTGFGEAGPRNRQVELRFEGRLA